MDYDAELTSIRRRLAAIEKPVAVDKKDRPVTDTDQLIQVLNRRHMELDEHVRDLQKHVRDGEAFDELRQALDINGPIMRAIKGATDAVSSLGAAIEQHDIRLKSVEEKATALRQDLDAAGRSAPPERGFEGTPVAEVARHPEIAPTAAPEARQAVGETPKG